MIYFTSDTQQMAEHLCSVQPMEEAGKAMLDLYNILKEQPDMSLCWVLPNGTK